MVIEQLHKLFLSSNGVSTDTRNISQNVMFIALKGDNFNGNEFASEAIKKGASYAIVDEAEYNTSNQTILVEDTLKTLQKLAIFHRNYLNIPIIALTGSNGKTTTKELISCVLSKKYRTMATCGNLNNHIGVPLTLLSMTKETEIGIVEMGANHKKEIEFLCSIAQPDFGYITNFGKAHLEGFGGIEGVIIGKSELYNYLLSENKYVFLNADDPIQKGKLSTYIKKFGFSQNDSDYFTIKLIGVKPFVKISVGDTEISSNLIGSYNFTNIAAAILIGKYFNVEITDIKEAIENYVPKNNRSQLLDIGTNKIILDAYNANPSSMDAALKNFTNIKVETKIAILGDMFELGTDSAKEHQALVNLIETLNLNEIHLVGEHFYDTDFSSENIRSYKSFNEFIEAFKESIPENASILIKGSRGMALERTLDFL